MWLSGSCVAELRKRSPAPAAKPKQCMKIALKTFRGEKKSST